MRFLLFVASLLEVVSVAFAQTAQAVTDNPIGAHYIATTPAGGNKGIYATVSAETARNGVMFTININGAELTGGPFLYHIHDQPVPASGNCTQTLAHLDPTVRGETPVCDKARPETCQVGDLSGKYGDIPFLPGFNAEYTDPYVSLKPGIGAFIGNRSFVLHYANKTRIACANFRDISNVTSSGMISPTGSMGGVNGSMSMTSTPLTSPTGDTTTGGAESSSEASSTPTGAAVHGADANGVAFIGLTGLFAGIFAMIM
ncbi:hypothetical protein K402DRAFT_422207 [Aulographum hederae CBS 113979]|uniref:superoxide dismutase n=1 Tax=Aulographum hederae CBS 113979 TaxID=1176131 RepID=A0A6G1GWQ9_9PEZI|nr:hypothetical protein K402DRAFT_422207 [Aulographum hederae CBS 113979]